MFLRKLEINNFRNIKKAYFNFDKKINIFIGENAQGKTNVLESIYFLSITKSHRTNNEFNLIKNSELYTKLSCTYEKEDESYSSLSILLNNNGKKVSVDNIMQKRISNYLSRLNVIMFCPDDLEIVKGSPSIRRKFLNIELSQLNNNYLNYLKNYNYILKERNEYLKHNNNFNKVYFDILTEKLIEEEIKILKERYFFIDEINEYLPLVYESIAKEGKITIEYISFVNKEYLKAKNVKDIIK